MTNELTSCCHTPYFADGVCTTCNQPCEPYEPEHGPLVNERIDFFPVIEQPIHTVITAAPEPSRIPRWNPNTDEEYDWHAQSISNETI